MLEWTIIITITVLAFAFTLWKLYPRKKRRGVDEDAAPLCSGCTADKCVAMGDKSTTGAGFDIEATRRKLVERAE